MVDTVDRVCGEVQESMEELLLVLNLLDDEELLLVFQLEKMLLKLLPLAKK